MREAQAMKRALRLALKGAGSVSPNPLVGAVILKEEQLIAEGYHRKYGENHAEIEAIKNSMGIDLSGATLVVNLEPCCHTGKTGPCTSAIIQKKFAKVIVGMKDPNPLVSGKGIESLIDAGIDCKVGILEEECRWVNRIFIHNMTSNLPYMILKVAQSIDGCIATSKGESKWITSEVSRKSTHKLRAEVDAILIGRKTASIDNPFLTVRNVKGRDPKRIIIDSKLSLPLTINAFKKSDRTNTFIICSSEAEQSRKAETLKLAGIKLIAVESDRDGRLDIKSALNTLYKEFLVSSILVEGGAETYSFMASKNLIDELHVYSAPIIIGNGLHSFSNYKINNMSDAKKMEIVSISKSGSDIHTIAVRKND